MKKLLSVMALGAAGLAAYGQGYIVFANTSRSLISTNSSLGGPATGLISGPIESYYFALFSAPSGTVDVTQFTFSGLYATNRITSAGGRFGTSRAVPVPGTAEVTPTAFFVSGWSANIGSSYESLTNYLSHPTFDAWFGQSEVRTMTTGAPDLPSPFVLGELAFQIPGFTLGLVTIPEPSSLSILSLGAAGAWLFRRRTP